MTDRDRNPSDPTSDDDAPSERTEDEVWQDLVSRLEQDDSTGPATGTPGPGPEPVSPAAPDPAAAAKADPRSSQAPSARPNGDPPAGPRDYTAPPEPEGFVPEEPAPLTGAQPLSVLAWIGAVGAPLAMLLSALVWQSAPWSAVLGMIAVFIASVAYLLLRLPSERNNDDDGAVV